MVECMLCNKKITQREEKVLAIPEGEKSWKKAVWVHRSCRLKQIEKVTGQKRIISF